MSPWLLLLRTHEEEDLLNNQGSQFGTLVEPYISLHVLSLTYI